MAKQNTQRFPDVHALVTETIRKKEMATTTSYPTAHHTCLLICPNLKLIVARVRESERRRTLPRIAHASAQNDEHKAQLWDQKVSGEVAVLERLAAKVALNLRM